MAVQYVTRRQLVSTSFGPLLLLEKEHPSGTVLARHDHPEENFTLILEGGMHELAQGRDFTCGPGSLLVKSGDAWHVNRYGDGVTRSFVAAWYDNRHFECVPRGIRFQDRGPAARIASRMYAEFTDPDADSPVVYEGLLWEVLVGSPSTSGRRPPTWLRRVHDRVVEEYRAGISIQSLARDASIHPEHLSRAFRSYYGIQIAHYARRLRLEWAANALRTSDRPLTEIAHAAGFSDQSHLTRCFRNAIGTTPARYRRDNRRFRPVGDV